jgi:hypothetical protein
MLDAVIAESDAGLARWARWQGEIFRDLPPWAKLIRNASIKVCVVLDVPDDVEQPHALAIRDLDSGSVTRSLVHERTLVIIRDEAGWVARQALGGDPRTDAGRGCIAQLRGLERIGHVERDTRHWWRPTEAGRKAAAS